MSNHARNKLLCKFDTNDQSTLWFIAKKQGGDYEAISNIATQWVAVLEYIIKIVATIFSLFRWIICGDARKSRRVRSVPLSRPADACLQYLDVPRPSWMVHESLLASRCCYRITTSISLNNLPHPYTKARYKTCHALAKAFLNFAIKIMIST